MIPVEARVAVALVGMVLAVAGIVLDNRIVVWVAIGVLAVAFILRYFAAGFPRGKGEAGAHRP